MGKKPQKKSNNASAAMNRNMEDAFNPRTSSAVLCSHPLSRDLQFQSFSLQLYSTHLIVESNIEFNYGRSYGLVGLNGCGKSTFLKCLGHREIPIPDHFDIF